MKQAQIDDYDECQVVTEVVSQRGIEPSAILGFS